MRLDRRTRYLASVAKGGRVPERAHGKYLLTGGVLICPTCGGHFEARKYPWKENPGEVYICSTRRRKPGVCKNTLALPIAETDDATLSTIEGDVLSPRVINELLALVDTSIADDGTRLAAERDRLRVEVERLVASIAAGVPPESVAPLIKKNQAEIARLEARLRIPRIAPPGIEQLRAALQQRSEQWKRDLRAEPRVARLVLRRLVGPMTLWDESERPEWCRWEAPAKPESLLDRLVPVHDGSSPTGSDTLRKPLLTIGLDFDGAVRLVA